MFACDVHAGDQPQAKATTTVSASYTTASASTATAPSSSQDPTKSPTGSTSTSPITSATSGPLHLQHRPRRARAVSAETTTRIFREPVRSHWVSFFRSVPLGLLCWRGFSRSHGRRVRRKAQVVDSTDFIKCIRELEKTMIGD